MIIFQDMEEFGKTPVEVRDFIREKSCVRGDEGER